MTARANVPTISTYNFEMTRDTKVNTFVNKRQTRVLTCLKRFTDIMFKPRNNYHFTTTQRYYQTAIEKSTKNAAIK